MSPWPGCRYFDMYPLETVPKLSAINKHAPQDEPSTAWNSCSEIRSFDDIRDATGNFSQAVPFGDNLAQQIRQAYFAGEESDKTAHDAAHSLTHSCCSRHLR